MICIRFLGALLLGFLFLGARQASLAGFLPPILRSIESYCVCKAIVESVANGKSLKLRQCHDSFQNKASQVLVSARHEQEGFYGYSYQIKYGEVLSREFCYWKYLGTPFPGQHLIYSLYNGGGSGVFSNLTLLEKKGDFLEITRKIDGGDRANGGISEPVFEKGKLAYEKALTPATLLAFGKEFGRKMVQLARLPLGDLADCANCYVAKAIFETDFKKVRLVKVLLERSLVDSPQRPPLQEAFDLILNLYLKEGKRELSPEEFGVFVDKILERYASKRH